MWTMTFTDEQIAMALRQHAPRARESGTPVADIGRKLGIRDTPCFCWPNDWRPARSTDVSPGAPPRALRGPNTSHSARSRGPCAGTSLLNFQEAP